MRNWTKPARTKIEAILISKKMTQQEFLEKYNKIHAHHPIGRGHLSDIVSGKKKGMLVETILRIGIVLKKSPNQLLDYEEKIKRQSSSRK